MPKIKPNPLDAQAEFIAKAYEKRDREQLNKQFPYPPLKGKREISDELDVCEAWIKQMSKERKEELKK